MKSFIKKVTQFRILLIVTIILLNGGEKLYSQTWGSIDFPSNMVWSVDELNGKLYLAHGGEDGIYEYDGSVWNLLSNYNNSSNTPHKSKMCVKKINNMIYAGAKDFNTIGEGIVHTFDGTSWSNLQNARFPYNANNKIKSFEQYNGTVYVGGEFKVPEPEYFYNLAKWNGTDWVSAGINISPGGEFRKLYSLQSKLFVVTQQKIYFFNAIAWDSAAFAFALFADAASYNNTLYVCGSIFTGTAMVNLGMYDGTTLTNIPNTYSEINRIFADPSGLYAIVRKTSQGPVFLVRYNGIEWSDVSFLVNYGAGLYPGFPGSELSDYNIIFSYANFLYVGGRFEKINNQVIHSLAKISVTQTGVQDFDKKQQQHFSLAQNYPNPFNPTTTINFGLKENSIVSLKIYNTLGQQVATLLDNETVDAGNKSVEFDASKLSSGVSAIGGYASGVYFYRLNVEGISQSSDLNTGSYTEQRKMILLK